MFEVMKMLLALIKIMPALSSSSLRKHDITTFAKPAVFHQIGTQCDYYRIQSIEFCTSRRSPPSSGSTVVFCVTGKNSRSTENGRVAPPLPYVPLPMLAGHCTTLCRRHCRPHSGARCPANNVENCWPSTNAGISRRPAT